jgi:predicted ATP-dependent endonuclease of OLD family
MIASLEAERDAALAKAAELETVTVGDDDEATDEPTDDEVMKALDPSVRERIEKAETERAALAERVAKMEDEALTAQYVAKAAEFRTVEQDVDGLAALLKDVAKNCSIESAQAIERVLKGATARLDEAHRLITAEIGTATALDATDAGRQIETLAKARAEQTGESMPVATAAILNDNPHLYEQARAERA